MSDLTEQLLFYDELPPERQKALRAELRDDPALARAFHRWQATQAHVAQQFHDALPERRLLVLYALSQASLSEAERHELETARPQIEQALRAHPALETIVERIQAERADFEATWKETVENQRAENQRAEAQDAGRANETPATRRADRAAAAPPGRPPAGARRWAWRAAAAFSVLAFAAIVFLLAERDWNTVTVTAEGQRPRRVELADGSAVRLMPGATLSYVDPDADAAFDRQATLEAGRAFFDIAHADDGFHLATPTAQVTVLGTRFGVTASERETEVVLAEGEVALAPKDAGGQVVTLRPGQRSRVAANARPTTPIAVESLPDALGWAGLFFFRDTPARTVAERLSAHYERPVRVAPALAEEQVTGTFAQERPLPETLETLAAALGATVDSSAGGYALVPARP